MRRERDERDAILDRLRACMQTAEAKRFGLSVLEMEIEHEGNWWHEPVASGMPDVNPFDCARTLNRIEEEFESAGTKLLLFPAGSEDSKTE